MSGSAFAKYHPVVNFVFFITAIVLTVVIFHPAALAVSLVMGVLYSVKLEGRKAWKYFFAFPFVVMILSVVINMLFVHQGITVLFYIGESPVTVEAAVYGACTALMIGAVIVWAHCYSIMMTSDRFMAVFGKRAPSTSLVFSMILRFLPRTKRQAGKIAEAQDLLAGSACGADGGAEGSKENCTEGGAEGGADKSGENERANRRGRVHKGMRVLSILTTWALENSIETADSMRARGYGLEGRTMYRKYKARPADVIVTVLMLAAAVWMFAAKAAGGWMFFAYPEIMMAGGAQVAVLSIVLALFYAAPLIIEIAEDIRWNRSVSKI